MKNYHIIAPTEREKYQIINAIRAAGAVLTGVSGYGSAYYIQLDANDDQITKPNEALEEMK
jgi:hypothetical protein